MNKPHIPTKFVKGQRYLIQAVTGRLYVYSKELAIRNDMSEYDPETAEYRIKKKQERLKELKEAPPKLVDPKILENAELEADLDRQIEEEEQKLLKSQLVEQGVDIDDDEIKTEEELEQEQMQEIINKDPEINAIEAMTDIQEVIDYIGEEYGIEVEYDSELDLHHYQGKAITLRTERLFEPKD